MNLCMAATYDPDPRAPLGFRVPFNLETGEVDRAALGASGASTTRSTWSPKYRSNLKSLRGIYIDCGWRDQYHIHYGTRILSKRLAAAGIRHTLRGIRRQPLRHRLPDGYQPAVSLPGAEAVTGLLIKRARHSGKS